MLLIHGVVHGPFCNTSAQGTALCRQGAGEMLQNAVHV